MASDSMFWVELATRMTVTAAFLVAATAVAERAGPLVGGLVATLPISAGPVYLFLALDHDASFIAASALASLAANAVTGLFALLYILVAQARGPLASLAFALGFWLLAIFLVRSFPWMLPGGLATAALIANTLPGLVGFALALLGLHLAAVSLGKAPALMLALAISIVWN